MNECSVFPIQLFNEGFKVAEAAKFLDEKIGAKEEIVIQVHHGVFHADDVACVAMIINNFMGTVKVVRTREDVPDADLVLDVGREDSVTGDQLKLDHHQPEARTQMYENGVKACALAKLMELLYVDEDDMKLNLLRKKIIWPIAANDNGQEIEGIMSNPLSWVKFYNPDDRSKSDEAFLEAVGIASKILMKIEESIAVTMASKEIWEKGLDGLTSKGIMTLEKGMPWMEYLFSGYEDKINFLVFPHAVKGWVLRTIPTKEGGFDAKVKMPEIWWGYSAENGDTNPPVKGMTFCHNTGFMAVFETEHDAQIAAVEAVMRYL
jgi:uncharacterized UPF0160 family protein